MFNILLNSRLPYCTVFLENNDNNDNNNNNNNNVLLISREVPLEDADLRITRYKIGV